MVFRNKVLFLLMLFAFSTFLVGKLLLIILIKSNYELFKITNAL
ncbi:hypothetical protein L1276_002589 [Flavobacterium sp. HSC-32F16]|nr:hypothetical protein [Flavobacterium sp. HSC-32F16]